MVREVERKSEIAAILNKNKDTFDDLIDSSNTKFPNWPDFPDRPRLIDKGSCNMLRSKSDSQTLSKEDCLDENVPITSLESAPKIQVSYVHNYHDITLFGSKSGKAQYENSQKSGEDGKDRRGRENRKDKRDHQENKVDLLIEESSNFEASKYYHIIYQC